MNADAFNDDFLDRLLVEQMAEAVVYCDRSGIIRRWNAGATKVFGHEAAEALGQSLNLIIPERLRQAHWRGFDAAIASGVTRLGGHPTLTRGLRKDGGKCYVEMSFALVADASGAMIGSVAVARDVTARIERERQNAERKGGAN